MHKTTSGKRRLNLNFLNHLRFNDIKLTCNSQGKKIKTLHFITVKEIINKSYTTHKLYLYAMLHDIKEDRSTK